VPRGAAPVQCSGYRPRPIDSTSSRAQVLEEGGAFREVFLAVWWPLKLATGDAFDPPLGVRVPYKVALDVVWDALGRRRRLAALYVFERVRRLAQHLNEVGVHVGGGQSERDLGIGVVEGRPEDCVRPRGDGVRRAVLLASATFPRVELHYRARRLLHFERRLQAQVAAYVAFVLQHT